MNSIRLTSSIVAASLFLGTSAFADTDKKTERTWKAKCASCHGQDGKGDTDKGKQLKIEDMTTAAFQAKSNDALKSATLDGFKKDMPAFKAELSPEQADALVAYMRTFKK